MKLSEARELLGSMKIPKECEVYDAMQIALKSIDKQIELGQWRQELKDEFGDKQNTPFCYEYIASKLDDLFILSEVNNINA